MLLWIPSRPDNSWTHVLTGTAELHSSNTLACVFGATSIQETSRGMRQARGTSPGLPHPMHHDPGSSRGPLFHESATNPQYTMGNPFTRVTGIG